MNRKIRLIWDFHGMDSEGTAKHHVKHLIQFMDREDLECLRSAVFTANEMHHMACITVNESDVSVIRDSLKPHRALIIE